VSASPTDPQKTPDSKLPPNVVGQTEPQDAKLLPADIEFPTGTTTRLDPISCYTYTTGQAVSVQVDIIPINPADGYSYYAGVYSQHFNSNGVLTVSNDIAPAVFTSGGSISVPATLHGNPTGCKEFVVIITRYKAGQSHQVVASSTFKICKTCPR
jgi:hypothetical protein